MRAFLLGFLLALPAAGLEPYLVKDIRPRSVTEGSNPTFPVVFGGVGGAVLFFVQDGSSHELWRSDGSEAGTFQLSDSDLPGPRPFAVTERLYFFLSEDPASGLPGLWVSDGTPAGTFRLTEPGVAVTSFSRARVAGILYFAARDAEHGAELWRTDGTPAGTRIVADLGPGSEGSDPRAPAAWRGRVWFGAAGALWSTDGTEAGTVQALDTPGQGSPDLIRVVNNRLTFLALPPGPKRVRQLWAGDGTARGTRPVTGLSGAVREPLVVHGNRLWFAAEGRKRLELWISDGTARGTKRLESPPFLELSARQDLPGRIVFHGGDGAHGAEPWVSDGTSEGTRLLRDVCPGECHGVPIPEGMYAGRLWFTAEEPEHGRELWSTDGTPRGTRRETDICPGSCSSWPYGLVAVGDRLLFVAWDGESGEEIWSLDGRVSDFESETLWQSPSFGAVLDGRLFFGAREPEHGAELWITDGTPEGTRLVEDINQIDPGGSFPRSLMALGNQAVFGADDGSPAGRGLWKSDGTEAGTVKIRTFGPEEAGGVNPYGGVYAEAGGWLFYAGLDPVRGLEPWRTDGTAEGTFRLSEEGALFCCITTGAEAVGGTVFFGIEDAEHGFELWATDGTREGTRLVRDIMPGPEGSTPDELTSFQGKLWFTVSPPFLGRELWVTDGTEAGTRRVPGFSSVGALTVHKGRLWFFADGGLWSTDGTEAGTRLEVGSLVASFLFSLGDRLVISSNIDGLWVTDGTPAGTLRIHERGMDTIGFFDVWAVLQGRLFYVVDHRLYVTDGTEAGTGPLLDREGQEIKIFLPGNLPVLGNRLVFPAPEGPDGLGRLVVWESDGTPAGTFPVQPPVQLLSPLDLVRAGDRVFFPAYDSSTGWELWAVE